jgi:NAD(P)H-hydrate epimerase
MQTIPALTPVEAAAVPSVSAGQMIEVDRLMVDHYGIQLLQMMELAGRHLAHVARVRFLAGAAPRSRVVVLAGTGGNGGGALVAARRLAGWGVDVSVIVSAEDDALAVGSPSLIIDGLIGYSLRGAPREPIAALIDWANRTPAPVLALDVPSGLDATTGAPSGSTIEATATMTLALPKIGLRLPSARAFVGELYLADIGVPPALYRAPSLGLTVPWLFARGDVVRLA